MAITRTDKIYSGTLGTSSTTYTINSNTTFILRGFFISNANSSSKKAELLIDSKPLLPYVTAIPAGDCLIRTDLNIPVTTGLVLSVKGESASNMYYYIWGIDEVTS